MFSCTCCSVCGRNSENCRFFLSQESSRDLTIVTKEMWRSNSFEFRTKLSNRNMYVISLHLVQVPWLHVWGGIVCIEKCTKSFSSLGPLPPRVTLLVINGAVSWVEHLEVEVYFMSGSECESFAVGSSSGFWHAQRQGRDRW